MKKKFALHNSYFKNNRANNLPDTILKIAAYLKENGELPFRYDGDNWIYDAFCERQKYRGVQNSQYLTPDATVKRMIHFASKYFTENWVLEPCCGTGQITQELVKANYKVVSFDIDPEMTKICEMNEALVSCIDFKKVDKNYWGLHRDQIIANPPYETPILTEFLEWIDSVQYVDCISVLLLPKGFIDKERPKATVAALRKFCVLEREDMRENFARTNVQAEIVVLKKI